MVFRDFALSPDLTNVYLKLETVNIFTSDFVDRYDQEICEEPGNEIIFKINKVPNNEIVELLHSLDSMTQDMSPVTFEFSDNHFEVWEHNGFEYEEGWITEYGPFQYDEYKAFHKQITNLPRNESSIYDYFQSVALKLDSLREILTENNSFELTRVLLNKIAVDRKRMSLCVIEDITKLKIFLSNYSQLQEKNELKIITTDILQLIQNIEQVYDLPD